MLATTVYISTKNAMSSLFSIKPQMITLCLCDRRCLSVSGRGKFNLFLSNTVFFSVHKKMPKQMVIIFQLLQHVFQLASPIAFTEMQQLLNHLALLFPSRK